VGTTDQPSGFAPGAHRRVSRRTTSGLPNNVDSKTILRREKRIDAHGADRHSQFQKNVAAVSTVFCKTSHSPHTSPQDGFRLDFPGKPVPKLKAPTSPHPSACNQKIQGYDILAIRGNMFY
jgi:hypothetical protein